ncbi:MAG: hypothetical protein LBR09_00800, partial [Endomicrobium sp.]|nr:hypothetical protein [Endomicrobium sp.]
NYEIDHIVPRSRGGSDSLVNMVLTKRKFNQDKGELTPYEWFHKKRSQDWDCYVKNVSEVFGSDKKYKKTIDLFASYSNKSRKYSDKKYKKTIDLLISDKTSDSRKTSLQATSYMEKTAQRLACLYFKWGMNTEGDKKKVLFFTGGKTADVRESLELDKILFANPTDDIEQKGKNRQNDRHHALDALVLSVLPEIRFNFKKIERKPDFFNKEFCAKEINKVYPERIKYVKPKLRETIYGLRYRFEKNEKTGKFEKIYYFISRFNSSIANFESLESARKEVENIFDLKIKRDFKEKLYEKNLTEEKWKEFLKGYTDDYKKIKKIAKVDSKGFRSSEIGEIKDVISNYGHKGAIKGQWIRDEESHQGQIVYKDEKGKWKVAPVYVFESLYKKCKEYKNKYKEVKFFRSGQLVELRRDYEGIKSGIYELKTVRLDGNTKIKNIHNQEECSKNIGYFIEGNGMTEYKNK